MVAQNNYFYQHGNISDMLKPTSNNGCNYIDDMFNLLSNISGEEHSLHPFYIAFIQNGDRDREELATVL